MHRRTQTRKVTRIPTFAEYFILLIPFHDLCEILHAPRKILRKYDEKLTYINRVVANLRGMLPNVFCNLKGRLKHQKYLFECIALHSCDEVLKVPWTCISAIHIVKICYYKDITLKCPTFF